MFSVFDKNRDGTIDFSEFVLIIAMGNKEDLDSRLELVFEM
jgi:Ca2+-binding EF-hand superfamily protein